MRNSSTRTEYIPDPDPVQESCVEIWECNGDPSEGLSLVATAAVFGNVELCLSLPEEKSGMDLLFIVTNDHAWSLLRWSPNDGLYGEDGTEGSFATAASGRFSPVHGDAFPGASSE